MPKRIIFEFEDDLDYQIQAIHSTVELFRGLSRYVDGIYRPSRIRKFGEGDPVRNNDIVVGNRLLGNLRKEVLKDSSIGIYFIVETKAGKTWADLTDVEKNKIHCGELHFKAVSDDTKFDWVNGYEDFVNKFGVYDSNKEDL